MVLKISPAVIGSDILSTISPSLGCAHRSQSGSPTDPGHQRPAATRFDKNASKRMFAGALNPLSIAWGWRINNGVCCGFVDFLGAHNSTQLCLGPCSVRHGHGSLLLFCRKHYAAARSTEQGVYVPSTVEINSFGTDCIAHSGRHAVSE